MYGNERQARERSQPSVRDLIFLAAGKDGRL